MKRTQRLERRLKDAEQDIISVMTTYNHEIELQRVRRDASKNGFVRTCAQQEIDQLTWEKETIEFEIYG